MSLTLEQKQAVVAEVHGIAMRAQSAIAAEYAGMTVAQMTGLRTSARAAGVEVRVVKNTLARRAFDGTLFECMQQEMSGPLALIFSNDDPGAGARVIRDYLKQNGNLVVKAIGLSGILRPGADLEKLANMPTLPEARAKLLGVMQAPATKLVRTLAEPGAKFVRLLSAYRDSKAA